MIEFQNVLVNVKNPPLKPVLESEISEVEAQLNLVFPADYKSFVTTFGAGELSIIFLQAFTPSQVMTAYRYESQERLAEYWFWEESPEILTQQRAIECFPFFGSSGGDGILFHPSDPNTWFILPHEEEKVVAVHNFKELVDYYLERERSAQNYDGPQIKLGQLAEYRFKTTENSDGLTLDDVSPVDNRSDFKMPEFFEFLVW